MPKTDRDGFEDEIGALFRRQEAIRKHLKRIGGSPAIKDKHACTRMGRELRRICLLINFWRMSRAFTEEINRRVDSRPRVWDEPAAETRH